MFKKLIKTILELENHKHMPPMFSSAFEPIANHYNVEIETGSLKNNSSIEKSNIKIVTDYKTRS